VRAHGTHLHSAEQTTRVCAHPLIVVGVRDRRRRRGAARRAARLDDRWPSGGGRAALLLGRRRAAPHGGGGGTVVVAARERREPAVREEFAEPLDDLIMSIMAPATSRSADATRGWSFDAGKTRVRRVNRNPDVAPSPDGALCARCERWRIFRAQRRRRRRRRR
jgi:hypothetical protein